MWIKYLLFFPLINFKRYSHSICELGVKREHKNQKAQTVNKNSSAGKVGLLETPAFVGLPFLIDGPKDCLAKPPFQSYRKHSLAPGHVNAAWRRRVPVQEVRITAWHTGSSSRLWSRTQHLSLDLDRSSACKARCHWAREQLVPPLCQGCSQL